MSEAEAITTRELERRLFERFPEADAEAWDHVGLSVGDPTAVVRGVACALDVTPAAIREAARLGCGVLLTHHPVCLEMPRVISPESSGAPTPGSSVWEAIASRVALIAMHTNLDCAACAALAMPRALGLQARPGIERGRAAGAPALGALSETDAYPDVASLARACERAFGRVAQVYGDPSWPVRRVAFYSGSMGSDGCADVRAARADVVVCGECGYHRALDLASVRVATVVLGHDVSELPHVACLRDAAVACGVPAGDVHVLDEPRRWRRVEDFARPDDGDVRY